MKDVFSIGEMDVDILYEYARNQKKSHALKGFENLLKKDSLRKDLQGVLSKHLATGYNGYIFQINKGF